VGHAYGLDHSNVCKDIMSYGAGCGAKQFLDRPVRCGEHDERDCAGGAATQNSYAHLLAILGPRRLAQV
jgi:hypothetical protein